ncbi:hypothetical protein BDF21DRAFT_335868 [Thamnidium elegans]|nr:hypothetical protein BDF21DRAFT_335868 [Thamnidium elegans]
MQLKHTPRYQMYIKSLKEQNFTVVGYARKSPGSENKENRNILLNRMVKCLKERSLCDIIFASTYSSAAEILTSRDMNEVVNIRNGLNDVDGNTQDMISYIGSSEKDICLVAIDFSGLSTNISDLTALSKTQFEKN